MWLLVTQSGDQYERKPSVFHHNLLTRSWYWYWLTFEKRLTVIEPEKHQSHSFIHSVASCFLCFCIFIFTSSPAKITTANKYFHYWLLCWLFIDESIHYLVKSETCLSPFKLMSSVSSFIQNQKIFKFPVYLRERKIKRIVEDNFKNNEENSATETAN